MQQAGSALMTLSPEKFLRLSYSMCCRELGCRVRGPGRGRRVRGAPYALMTGDVGQDGQGCEKGKVGNMTLIATRAALGCGDASVETIWVSTGSAITAQQL